MTPPLPGDPRFMERAISLANFACALGEVPIGCVIVRDGIVVGEAFNRRELDRNALAHAEISAINRACSALSAWRLIGCDLYVTLEPCPMCAGAIVNARISRVFFGAYDKKAGAFSSVLNLNNFPLNHKPQVCGGLLEPRCSALLSDFFTDLRRKKKKPAIPPPP